MLNTKYIDTYYNRIANNLFKSYYLQFSVYMVPNTYNLNEF